MSDGTEIPKLCTTEDEIRAIVRNEFEKVLADKKQAVTKALLNAAASATAAMVKAQHGPKSRPPTP